MLQLSDLVCSACGGNIWCFSVTKGHSGRVESPLPASAYVLGADSGGCCIYTGRRCRFPWTDGKNDKLKTYVPHRKHFSELFGRLTAIRWGTQRCREPGGKVNPWKHRRCAGKVVADLTAENQNGVFPPWRDEFFFFPLWEIDLFIPTWGEWASFVIIAWDCPHGLLWGACWVIGLSA